jgi:glycosyltransferase involved in cell wall biosynthesis
MTNPVFATSISEGCQMHRIANPASMLEYARILPIGFQEIPANATHIVFNQLFTYNDVHQQNMLDVCRAQGLKIVLDVDDYWHVPKTHHRYENKQQTNYAAEVEFCIKHADVIWCASKALYRKCKELNKNSHYIPNAAPLMRAEPKGQGERFGYVATAADHYHDAKLLSKSFGKLRRGKLPTAQVGWLGMRQTEQDQKMRTLFESAGHCFFAPYQTHSAFWWHYRTFDVALAPLVNNEFNNCKSALKAIEAGAMGCAFICSDAEPYSDLEHGVNCLKSSNDFDWFRNMRKLNKDPNLAHELSQNLQDYILDVYDPHKIAEDRQSTLV